MTKIELIEVCNAMVRGTPVSFQEKLLPMFSEYLTENNIENSDKMINLIVQNPQLIQQAFPEVVEYFGKKFNVFVLMDKNLRPILYYE